MGDKKIPRPTTGKSTKIYEDRSAGSRDNSNLSRLRPSTQQSNNSNTN